MRLKEEVSPILEEMLACDSAELAFEMESPAEYGNEELIFKGDRFRFRVTRDRGQVFLDIAPRFADRDWYMLPRLFEFLDLGPEEEFSPEDYGPTTGALLRKQAHVFVENVEKIGELLSSENYEASHLRLKEFWQRKSREIFGPSSFALPSSKRGKP